MSLNIGQFRHTSPFISVCIPTYNRADYIKEAIDSALDQTYHNYEIVIVDDGSTDSTMDIVESYNSDKISYHKKQNEGIPFTRNKLIELAKGDYILWLDSDDKLVPNILEVYANFVSRYPDVSVFYGDLQIFGNLNHLNTKKDYYQKNEELLAELVWKNVLPNPGALIKKTIFTEYGNYNVDFRSAEDYHLWTRLASKVQFKHIESVTIFYRMHETNVCGDIFDGKNEFKNESNVLTSMINSFSLSKLFPFYDWNKRHTALPLAYLDIAKTYAKWNDKTKSLDYYEKAFKALNMPLANVDFINVLQNMRAFIKDDDNFKTHIDMIVKFLPTDKDIKITEVTDHYSYYKHLLFSLKNHRKILFVVHDFPPYNIAGIQLYAIKLAKRLKEYNIKVDIFHPIFLEHNRLQLAAGLNPDLLDYTIRKTDYEGLDVYSLIKPYDPEYSLEKIKNYKVGVVFTKFLREHHYDLVHFHSFGQLSLILAEIIQDLKIPNFFTIHDKWFLCYYWHQITSDVQLCDDNDSLEKCTKCLLTNMNYNQDQFDYITAMLKYRKSEFYKVFMRFDKVFAVSEYSKNCHYQHFPREIIVNNIGFAELNYKRIQKQKDTFTFGYAGRIVPLKGLHLLINAFSKLTHPNLELKLYGFIQHAQYYETIQALMAKDSRIKLYNEYKEEELEKIMSEFDVIVIPSMIENYPLVAIEAFQYKVPVIASNVGGIPEIVKHGVNGYLFNNNDTNDLHQKMKFVVENKNFAQEMPKELKIPREIEDDVKWHYEQYLNATSTKTIPITKTSPEADIEKIKSGQITKETETKRLKLPKDAFCILYAPTHKTELSSLPFIKEKIIEILPTPNSILFIKLHENTPKEHKDLYCKLPHLDKRVYYVTESEITPYIALADLLITDASNIKDDFTALDKPVFTFTPQTTTLDEMKIAVIKTLRKNKL